MFTRLWRHRRRRVFVTAATAVLAAAGAVTVTTLAGPQAAAEPSGCSNMDRYTVCTTYTPDHKPDTAISDEMARHIDHTERGDSIRAAMYLWELKDDGSNAPEKVANALVAAKKRGVDVKVVLGAVDDISDGDKRNQRFRDLMNANGIHLTNCEDACQDTSPNGRKGAMHNKFFLIQNGGSNNVLLSSSNLSVGQVSDFQNMIITRGDEKLFDFMTQYWNRLDDKSWNGWSDGDKKAYGDYDDSKAYAFWRAKGDPVLGNLNNVTDCNSDHNRVWVAASMSGRDSVRARLKELHDMGCDVRAVIAPGPGNKNEEWLQAIGLSKAKVKDLKYHHNKFILVDAKYHGEWQKVMWTGSHNHLNDSSLRNSNDINLRIIRDDVFDVYARYFITMFDNAQD